MIVNAQIHAKYMLTAIIMNILKIKEGLTGLNYPMLARNNYTAWYLKMKVSMQIQRVWLFVIPNDPKVAVEVRTDKIAMTAIYQGILEDNHRLFLEEIRERSPGCDQNDVHGSKLSEERKSANIES